MTSAEAAATAITLAPAANFFFKHAFSVICTLFGIAHVPRLALQRFSCACVVLILLELVAAKAEIFNFLTKLALHRDRGVLAFVIECLDFALELLGRLLIAAGIGIS